MQLEDNYWNILMASSVVLATFFSNNQIKLSEIILTHKLSYN